MPGAPQEPQHLSPAQVHEEAGSGEGRKAEGDRSESLDETVVPLLNFPGLKTQVQGEIGNPRVQEARVMGTHWNLDPCVPRAQPRRRARFCLVFLTVL